MTLQDILDQIDIQSEYKVVYYDDKKNERIEVKKGKLLERNIRFMYSENDILYFELDDE